MISTITIITLSVLLGTSLFIIRNLLRKNETQEDILVGYLTYLDSISKIIELSKLKMADAHLREAFQSDDEIGFFFKQLDGIQNVLNEFILTDGKGKERDPLPSPEEVVGELNEFIDKRAKELKAQEKEVEVQPNEQAEKEEN